MKLLFVSHAPLTTELGAAQIALHLATALRARGHDALAWSPAPPPPGVPGWGLPRRQRRAIEGFVAEHGPFDVIDTPAITASADLDRRACLVVRSIQPELRYLWQDVRADLGQRLPPSARSVARAVLAAPRAPAIVAGWRRARLILCMGRIELAWMCRRFPQWRSKLGSYLCAPSPDDRSALLEIRQHRTPRGGEGCRYLWIGRWAAHKGTGRLVSWMAQHASAAPCDTLTIAGCGPAAERDLPAAWLRSGRVRLVPSFSRTELPALLASHDAGVFTSAVEGWGLSLNEMLESGMPVFATEAGAVADLRPYFPETLHTFPPPVRIASWPRLEDLETNGYLARFDWAAIARSYEEQLLGSKSHGG